jgi:hypothetical protein
MWVHLFILALIFLSLLIYASLVRLQSTFLIFSWKFLSINFFLSFILFWQSKIQNPILILCNNTKCAQDIQSIINPPLNILELQVHPQTFVNFQNILCYVCSCRPRIYLNLLKNLSWKEYQFLWFSRPLCNSYWVAWKNLCLLVWFFFRL